MAHTPSRCFSASATAASQAPLESTSGPATITGFFALVSRSASARTASGSAPARPVTSRPIDGATWASSTSTVQSSIGSDSSTGPLGGSVAMWIPRASAAGTSSARGGS